MPHVDPIPFGREWQTLDELAKRYKTLSGSFNQRGVIRQYYMEAIPEIVRLAKESPCQSADLYPLDWEFNRNESLLWGIIRRNKYVAMYPEFPVLNRFVDFGNPYLRIALEADSLEHHDEAEDRKRDEEFLRVGWRTFRITFKENQAPALELGEIDLLRKDEGIDQAEEALEYRMMETGDGVVDAVGFFYFMAAEHRHRLVQRFSEFPRFAEATLRSHRLVEFPLPEVAW